MYAAVHSGLLQYDTGSHLSANFLTLAGFRQREKPLLPTVSNTTSYTRPALEKSSLV